MTSLRAYIPLPWLLRVISVLKSKRFGFKMTCTQGLHECSFKPRMLLLSRDNLCKFLIKQRLRALIMQN